MKKWSIKKIVKEVVTTLLMIFLISMVMNYLRKPDTSSQLPNLNLKLISGQEVSLSKKEKPTIIHFWATWCPTCKLEAPNLESIKDSIHLITIAVNSGSSDELKKFMEERGYTYPVVNDTDGILAKKFGVEAFPTTFIYDSNGTLRFSEVGYSTTLGLKARVGYVRD